MIQHRDIVEIENFEGEFDSVPFTTLEQIATDHIRDVRERGGLDTRNCDTLDFLEVPVWKLRESLARAYLQGLKDATATTSTISTTTDAERESGEE